MKTSTFVKGVQGVAEIAGSARSAKAKSTEPAHVGIFVDQTAPADCISWVKSAFTPERDTGFVHVELLEDSRIVRINARMQVACVIAGNRADLIGDFVEALSQDDIPVCIICESSVDAPNLDGRIAEGATVSLVTASSEQALKDKLGEWMVSAMPESLTLASCFPFVRAAKTTQLIGACATTNAVVGALSLPSAAQMPIMTINQAKMALDLTSIHGIDELSEQAPAIVGVVGAGFAYRGLARSVLKRFPGLGIVAKAGIAFAGTFATGKILDYLLDNEQEAQSLEAGVKEFVSSALDTVMELSQSAKA